jgi:drug/metabolite transporter (DMT)-like permease
MPVHKPLLGIALMLASAAFLATKDGLAKTFLHQVGPMQMIWFQYAGSFVIMALISVRSHGWMVLKPVPLGGQFLRGIFSAAAVTTLYWALTYLPLADATAMFMLSPVVVAMLSPFILGEHIDIERKLAIAAGFLGVLVIVKPGFGGDVIGYAIGLLSGVLLGLYFIANRKLSGRAPPLLNVTHNSLMGTLALTPFLPLFWSTPPASVTPKVTTLIALAVVGQGLMITAFMYAPAGVIAPYSYAMLVFAAIIGYVVFGNLPDLTTWIGMALIVGAGLYIAHRERRSGAASAKPPSI